tara:strand:+ start:1984 stop:2823 length:840 start_codon:yes stop_codon:yes gene_type:complete
MAKRYTKRNGKSSKRKIKSSKSKQSKHKSYKRKVKKSKCRDKGSGARNSLKKRKTNKFRMVGGVLPGLEDAAVPYTLGEPCQQCNECVYYGTEFCTNPQKTYYMVREIDITEDTVPTFATYVKTPINDTERNDIHKNFVKGQKFVYIIYSSDTNTLCLLNFDCKETGKNCSGHSSFPDLSYDTEQKKREDWYNTLSSDDKKAYGLVGPPTTKDHIVYYAGEISFDGNGNIAEWNNNSGHFTPHSDQAEEVATETGLNYELFKDYQNVDGIKRVHQVMGE